MSQDDSKCLEFVSSVWRFQNSKTLTYNSSGTCALIFGPHRGFSGVIEEPITIGMIVISFHQSSFIEDIRNCWLHCFTNPLELGTRVSLSHRQPDVLSQVQED